MSLIHNLREKSDKTKNKIAILAAVGFTVLIVLTWFMVQENKQTDQVVKENSTSDSLKPLFLIFKNAKDGFQDSKASVSDSDN